jgi:pteridine reductase
MPIKSVHAQKEKEPFKGRVALVTGAGVRLGNFIAAALAQRGCDLILHCRRSHREAEVLGVQIRALGRRATVLRAELGCAQNALKLARLAEKAFGRVDILINSAAIFGPTPLERLTVVELDRYLDVNLKAPYILSSEIGRQMKQRGYGAIVNLACVSAFRPWRDYVPYSISKAGVVALTTGLSKILGPEVRVNAVAPGTVLPPKGMPVKALQIESNRLPLKKIGTPDDVVEAVIYLCEADFVTGQVLCVDGGRSIV